MNAVQTGEGVVERVLAFGAVLRAEHLAATPARMLDALRALDVVGLDRREDVRAALRANLASSPEECETFDRAFDRFWGGDAPHSAGRLETDAALEGRGEAATFSASSDGTEGPEHRFGRGEVDRLPDLRAAWPGLDRGFDRAVATLVRRLASRRSRRLRPDPRGRIVDLRRSLRRGISRGLGGLELARAARRVRKTRLVLVCDVSGSMERATAFVLPFLLAVQRRVRGSRTAVFSTRSTEVTRELRRRDVGECLEHVARVARHWSGGTDLGGALAAANRSMLGDARARSTLCVIVSDGFDQGDPERVAREMETLRRRCRSVVWVNPLVGTEGYEPSARGMRAALPFVDHFLGCRDPEALRRLCVTLGRERRRRP